MWQSTLVGNLYNVEEKTSGKGAVFATAALRDSVRGEDGNWNSRFFNLVLFGNNDVKLAKELGNGSAVVIQGDTSAKIGNNGKVSIRVAVTKIVKCPKDFSQENIPTKEVVPDETAELEEDPEFKSSPFS